MQSATTDSSQHVFQCLQTIPIPNSVLSPLQEEEDDDDDEETTTDAEDVEVMLWMDSGTMIFNDYL